MQAKKNLGQNFLINDTIINNIVSIFDYEETDLIIEIGPGMGALTKHLLNTTAKLICIELDTDMRKYLNKYESDKCQIIYDDILKVNLKELLNKYTYNNLYIIGNLPYYITSPIIEYITKSTINPTAMAFMVQKEVADRYSAKPGNSNYGYMSVYLDYHYEVKKVLDVNKNNFNPVPKVDSAVITLKTKKHLNVLNEDFFDFLKICFTHKRKTLKNNLKALNIKNIDIKDNIRAEELSLNEFIELYKNVKR